MKFLLLAMLLPGSLAAQFFDLATTDDGGQVYFSSSYRQTGSDQLLSPKIFRYTAGHFELYRQVPETSIASDLNQYQLIQPTVSGDGQVVAFDKTGPCGGGSFCSASVTSGAEVSFASGPAPMIDIFGWLQVNQSGRYVFQNGFPGGVAGSSASFPARLLDLQQGTSAEIDALPASYKQAVTDDGSVLLLAYTATGGFLSLWKAGVTRPLAASRTALQAQISPSGATVAYVAGDGALIAFRTADGAETLLDRVGPYPFIFSLSNDGAQIAYLAPGADGSRQLFLQNTNGTGRQQLTHEAAGVVSAVLAGAAAVAYAGTGSGRLLRIHVPQGDLDDLSGVTPTINEVDGAFSPGGLVTITGANLVDSQGKAELFYNNSPAAPVQSSSSRVVVQTSYSEPVGETIQLAVRQQGSAFEAAFASAVTDAHPSFIGSFQDAVLVANAAHSDFHGPVTMDDPAVPGEAVHFYLTGLGSVTPSLADRTVTPGSPLYKITARVVCSSYYISPPLNAPVLFAGLAPGSLGIYQLDVMIPGGVPGNVAFLTCYFMEAPPGIFSASAQYYLRQH